LQEIATELMSVRGSTIGREELAQKLERRREARLAAEGLSTIGGLATPCKKTVANTMNLLQAMPAFCNVKRPVHKAEKRLVAETSLMSAVTFASTAGATHFVEGVRRPEYEPLPTMAAFASPPKSSSLTMQLMISKALGGVPVYPVHPAYVLSTDDTTLFVFEGTDVDDGARVCSREQRGNVHGTFTTKSRGHLCGQRVRFTVTFSAGGYMAPLFMTVTGLSDSELPQSTCQDGVLILKIPGLCVGGTVDPRIQNYGYVAFIRSRKDGIVSEESPEMAVFRYYRTNILLPWIEELRLVVHNHPSDAPVPDELTAWHGWTGGCPNLLSW